MIALHINLHGSISVRCLHSLKYLFRTSVPLALVLACVLPAWAGQGAIIGFDPSGSVATSPAGINSQGAIAGTYNDASGARHGFVLKGGG